MIRHPKVDVCGGYITSTQKHLLSFLKAHSDWLRGLCVKKHPYQASDYKGAFFGVKQIGFVRCLLFMFFQRWPAVDSLYIFGTHFHWLSVTWPAIPVALEVRCDGARHALSGHEFLPRRLGGCRCFMLIGGTDLLDFFSPLVSLWCHQLHGWKIPGHWSEVDFARNITELSMVHFPARPCLITKGYL